MNFFCLLQMRAAVAATLVLFVTGLSSADVTLVANQTSSHCIFHTPNAPSSVRLAAKEIQEYMLKATGVMLPIFERHKAPEQPLISLGENIASRDAGITINEVPLEGYRIATKGNDLYLLGIDTPDGKLTAQGGTSNGTLNAAYTFLEEFVGVRWLMPGEIGEYVPSCDKIVLPDMNRSDKPGFASRRLAYVQNDNPLVKEWLRRQKQGYSLSLNHSHSWQYVIPPNLYEQHPDWFPMINGVRPPPVGDRYKLETTNPKLVEAFANRIIDQFKKDQKFFSNSISPTDSADWSTSPESKALYDKDPHGRMSVTPLILDFYNKVAQRVRVATPSRMVCGYIYSDFLYPPSTGIPAIEPNLCLVLAPHISYGYGLYRSSSMADWEQLLKVWSKSTGMFAYYDLPVIFVQSVGAPNPPGIPLLKSIYPRLSAVGTQEVYIYGVSAWGHGAITNYLLAKLNWDPTADVDALVTEFFRKAYGAQAGGHMQKLFADLDDATRRYFESSGDKDHVLTRKILQGIYLPQLSRMEFEFRHALAVVSSDAEKARLQLFQKNIYGFYRYLQNEGLISKQRSSVFVQEIPDQSFESPTGKPYDISWAMEHIDMKSVVINPVSVKRIVSPIAPEKPVSPFLLRGKVRALLLPNSDGEVSVSLHSLNTRGDQVRCYIHDVRGKLVLEKTIIENDILRFHGTQDQTYYLHILAAEASFGLNVKGASYALDSRIQEKGLHFLADLTPVYFNVPEGFGEFFVTLSGWRSEGQNFAADVLSPNGGVEGTIDLRQNLAVRKKLFGDAHGGVWTLVLRKPNLMGGGDDVWVSIDERLSPWLVLNPKALIIVE
jgi:hypothetical protein